MKDENAPKRSFLKGMKSKLKSEDSQGFGEKLGHLKKVVVAAPTAEGLDQGLDKAQEILKKRKDLLGLPDEDESQPMEMGEQSMEGDCDHLGPECPHKEEGSSDSSELFDSLKDLSPEDMQKAVEFLQAMLAGKELKQE